MKKILVIVFSFSGIICFSQSNKDELSIFYYVAIKNHIDNAKDMFLKDVSAVKPNNLYFVIKNVSMDLLPKNIKDYEINYINIYAKKHKKLMKKGVQAIFIQPLKLKGNQVIINLTDFRISYKNKNYDFSNNGGSKTIFEYSCVTNKWVDLETIFTGI